MSKELKVIKRDMTLFNEQSDRSERITSSRRSFMWKLGAGASAVIASTTGMGKSVAGENTDADMALKLAKLEDEQALRNLHQSYEQAVDQGRYDELVAFFADDAEVIFNGGVFTKHKGINRLFQQHFRVNNLGKRMEPAPGFEMDVEQERVRVADDRQRATAEFPYSIKLCRQFETVNSLASMARLHGEGLQSWWEGGAYKVTYIKDSAESEWKISRLDYATQSRADFRPGRSWAGTIEVNSFSGVYPEDKRGPDRLV